MTFPRPFPESPRTRRGIAAWSGSRRHQASAESTQGALRHVKELISAGERVQLHGR